MRVNVQKTTPMKRFSTALAFLPRHKRFLLVGLLAVILTVSFDLGSSLVVRHGINRFKEGITREALLGLTGVIVAFAVLKSISRYLMRTCIMGAARRVETKLRSAYFDKLKHQSQSYFQKTKTGDLISRCNSDIESVCMFLGMGLMLGTRTVLMLPLALGVLAFLNIKLALYVSIPLAGICLTVGALSPFIRRHALKSQERLADISTIAQENFNGIRIVKGYVCEDTFVHRFETLGRAYMDSNMRLTRVRGLTLTLIHAVKDLGLLLIIMAGGADLIRGELSTGDFFLFIDYLQRLFWPMIALGWLIAMYHRAGVSMNRINEVIEASPDISDPSTPVSPQEEACSIEFENVSLSYNGKKALDGIALKIQAGKTCAVTGRTGSGKSTLLKLVVRLVDPSEGRVVVRGCDTSKLRLKELRTLVGYVPQEAFLFSDTLKNNIEFGSHNPHPEDAEHAADLAGLGADLLRRGEGLSQEVGERGIILSGGQRQRVTLARALIMKPEVLLLDDCFSAVDTSTEKELLENLKTTRKGRTTVMVSLRIASIRDADLIVFMEDGRITETGTHDELMEMKGSYFSLHKQQMMEQELNGF